MARIHSSRLPDMQWRFVQEYLLDMNATQAYQRAGYKASGESARRLAARLLTKVDVVAAIQREQAARIARSQLTQDSILEEITLLAKSDITHYVIDNQGNPTLASGAPPHAMRAISSMKKKIIPTESGYIYETEIKLWNKPASLRMGGEHLGTFKGAAPDLPDVHVHIHSARERLVSRVGHLAQRHIEDAVNGH